MIDPIEGIRIFAATISSQPLGLAPYHPEHWAKPTRCFENAQEKCNQDGGAILLGWTFYYRISPGIGEYLFVTHHAVWHAPNGSLIDVTPFHENPKHHPITENGGVLFLVDDAAQLVVTEHLIAPLPLRFFPLGDDKCLLEYVGKLNQREKQKCLDLYEGGTESACSTSA